MEVSPDGKTATFVRGNDIFVTPLTAAKASLDKAVDTSDMIAVIDYPQEWAQIFDETWRAFRDGFYLENMHGVDWNAIRQKYAVLLPHVKTRLDLNYVIGAMISELACGHAYVNPGDTPRPENIPMGLLGQKSRATRAATTALTAYFPGAPYSENLRSPLALPGLDVKEGDYITAIDGVDLAGCPNIYSRLIGKAGKLTELKINSRPQPGMHARSSYVRSTTNISSTTTTGYRTTSAKSARPPTDA